MFFEGDISALLPACPPVTCSEGSYLRYLGVYDRAVSVIANGIGAVSRGTSCGCGCSAHAGGVGECAPCGDVGGSGVGPVVGGGSGVRLEGQPARWSDGDDAVASRGSAAVGQAGAVEGSEIGGATDGGAADGSAIDSDSGVVGGSKLGGCGDSSDESQPVAVESVSGAQSSSWQSASARVDGDGGAGVGRMVGGDVRGVGVERVSQRGKHYEKNKKKKERMKALRAELRAVRERREKVERMKGPWRGYCETTASGPSPPVSSSTSASQTLVDAKQAAEESLARRRVVENELAIVKTKAQIASYADVEKSKAIADLKIARIAQWNNEARMKSQKSWADYKRSLEASPVPSFKASDLPSAASAGEYWWKQQCLKSKEMEEQIKHLEAVLKASMPYVSPEGLEKMREVPDPEPVIDPEFEALKRAHRELAAAEGLDGYDSGDDIGYDLFMPPSNL